MTQTARRKSTLRDVAREAGVSVATVSRVLNDTAFVAPETRARVGAAIEALQFAPSAAARSLNIGKTRTIGSLIPTLDHSIFARYLNALEHTLSARGYGLVVAVTGGDLAVEAQKADDLLSLGVDALIISGIDHSEAFDAIARRFDVPVLATSFYAPNAPYPTIGYNNAAIAEMAVSYLHDLGHSDIAVFHGPVSESDRTKARMEGAAAGSAQVTTYETPLSVAGGAAALAALLDAGGPTTAVLCLSDVLALGALFEAQRRGLSIPDDLSIMGFDNLEWSAVSTPGITTLELPAVAMGRAAATALVDHLANGHPIAPQELPAEIVERGSVADLR